MVEFDGIEFNGEDARDAIESALDSSDGECVTQTDVGISGDVHAIGDAFPNDSDGYLYREGVGMTGRENLNNLLSSIKDEIGPSDREILEDIAHTCDTIIDASELPRYTTGDYALVYNKFMGDELAALVDDDRITIDRVIRRDNESMDIAVVVSVE